MQRQSLHKSFKGYIKPQNNTQYKKVRGKKGRERIDRDRRNINTEKINIRESSNWVR